MGVDSTKAKTRWSLHSIRLAIDRVQLTLEGGKGQVDLDLLRSGKVVDELLILGKFTAREGIVVGNPVWEPLGQGDGVGARNANGCRIDKRRGDDGLGVDRRHDASGRAVEACYGSAVLVLAGRTYVWVWHNEVAMGASREVRWRE